MPNNKVSFITVKVEHENTECATFLKQQEISTTKINEEDIASGSDCLSEKFSSEARLSPQYRSQLEVPAGNFEQLDERSEEDDANAPTVRLF